MVCNFICSDSYTDMRVDFIEDSFVTIKHYKNLQDMIEKRRLEKEAQMLLVKSLAVESKKSKSAAAAATTTTAAPNLVLQPSLSDKIYKQVVDVW